MDSSAAVRPRFKSCVQPIISSDSGLFLLSEGRQAWIPDRIYATVAPMLDGAHEVEAIFAALSDTYPVEQVFAALDRPCPDAAGRGVPGAARGCAGPSTLLGAFRTGAPL
jgi:hypothetical protein